MPLSINVAYNVRKVKKMYYYGKYSANGRFNILLDFAYKNRGCPAKAASECGRNGEYGFKLKPGSRRYDGGPFPLSSCYKYN